MKPLQVCVDVGAGVVLMVELRLRVLPHRRRPAVANGSDWEQRVRAHLSRRGAAIERVTTDDLLAVLEVAESARTQPLRIRIGQIMTRLGWTRCRDSHRGRPRRYFYERPSRARVGSAHAQAGDGGRGDLFTDKLA